MTTKKEMLEEMRAAVQAEPICNKEAETVSEQEGKTNLINKALDEMRFPSYRPPQQETADQIISRRALSARAAQFCNSLFARANVANARLLMEWKTEILSLPPNSLERATLANKYIAALPKLECPHKTLARELIIKGMKTTDGMYRVDLAIEGMSDAEIWGC